MPENEKEHNRTLKGTVKKIRNFWMMSSLSTFERNARQSGLGSCLQEHQRGTESRLFDRRGTDHKGLSRGMPDVFCSYQMVVLLARGSVAPMGRVLRDSNCFADFESWSALFRARVRGGLRPWDYPHAVGCPRVGTRKAELMETPIMLAVTIVAARWIILRLGVPFTPCARLGLGFIALLLCSSRSSASCSGFDG